jgi:predicted MFS family arabinose efflux permease
MANKTTTAAVGGTVFVLTATVISFLISLAASSMKTTVQVLFLPIATDFEVNRGTLAIATTLFAVVTGVTSSLVGNLADRIGPVPVLAIGTAACGLVLLLCATAGNVWLFIAGYGVFGAIGFTMLSFVPLGVLADRLFRGRNAGLLYALLTNGAAVGYMTLVPLWANLETSVSWNRIIAGVAVAFLVVLLPLSLLLLAFSTRRGPTAKSGVTLRDGLLETVRNRQMVVLAIAFFCCGTTMAFFDVHFFPHMQDHGVHSAVSSVSLTGLGMLEIIGSLVSGRLCDRGLVRATLVGAYIMRAASMVLLFFFPANAMVIAFGAVFGASYLATVIATTIWATRVMPQGTRGTAIGLLWLVHMVGVAASSQGGAILADIRGNYTATIATSIVLTMAAAFMVSLLPNPPTDADADQPVATAGLSRSAPADRRFDTGLEPGGGTQAVHERGDPALRGAIADAELAGDGPVGQA